MKKAALFLILSVCTISCTDAQTKAFSKKTNAEKLVDLNGTEIPFKTILEKYKGKTILMEVWASWCGDCVGAMPKIKELQATHPEVVYVFVSMDKSFDKWKAGIEKHQLKGEHYWVQDEKGMKGSFGKSIDLDWIPRYIIINAKGEIELYRAIETEFDKINATLNTLK
ncbi:TlpA family protein disulfide reductase [Flavobacterium aciduliphilum]|jgi:thiol-disulfide isomerase/thioredoxin|uniref:Thiol-disulfide isomerase/thioredoxin n=1 Tax=Flavobacterium aciduliphilum TaxID=1101402 RepID=A0A328YAZ5_9FLAO|nr:TlpA disulfide reductase family protein [Flavobacterium aciduliphilum]RAR70780.1 thiol-disulfide isomerase/thioredoxin [Flavobacterium aciduliphilum]